MNHMAKNQALCGYVVMWLCGYVVMWLCGYVVMWLCGYVGCYCAEGKASSE